MQDKIKNRETIISEGQDRRKVIKKIVTGAGVLAGYSVLPDKWIRPIVGQIILPAHAATSGTVTKAEQVSSSGSYNTTEVYTLRSFAGNNKRFTWLSQTGAYYGGQVKFVFSNGCGELVVPDASVTHGADGTRNHDQAFYFCGTDFKPGTPENNNNVASVFAPPNCPAATVTIHYNI